jgi:hypothetical protein
MKYFLLLLALATACSSPDASSVPTEDPIKATITPRGEDNQLLDTTQRTAAQQARNYDGCP